MKNNSLQIGRESCREQGNRPASFRYRAELSLYHLNYFISIIYELRVQIGAGVGVTTVVVVFGAPSTFALFSPFHKNEK